MYWNTWDQTVPEPGGSYATHPAHAIFHPIFITVGIADVIVQFYTLYLMLRVAAKQLKEYRFFMMLCTVWDICFAITLDLLFQPRLHMPLSTCWTVMGPLAIFGNEGARIGIAAAFWFGTALIASQYYCLMFRISAVLITMPEVQRRFLSVAFTVFFLCVIATASCLVASAVYLANAWEPDQLDMFFQVLWEKDYFSSEDTSVFCFNMYIVKPGPTVIIDTNALCMKLIAAIAAAFFVFHTFFASGGFWIIFRLRKDSAKYSDRTRKMHLQFTMLLLLQMLCPVLCIVVPVLIPLITMISANYVSLVGFYCCLVGVSLFPMINAFLTIGFVQPYRVFTLKWMGTVVRYRWKPKVQQQPEMSSQQSMNTIQPRSTVRFISVRVN